VRAVQSPPAAIIYNFVTLPTVPLYDRIGFKFRFPTRRLRLLLVGDALGRCVCRHESIH
jgi:hypothetical protein